MLRKKDLVTKIKDTIKCSNFNLKFLITTDWTFKLVNYKEVKILATVVTSYSYTWSNKKQNLVM